MGQQLITLVRKLFVFSPSSFQFLFGQGSQSPSFVPFVLQPLPAPIDGLENAPIEEVTQQGDEDEEVDDLCSDGEPVDHRGSPRYWPLAAWICCQIGLAKSRIIEMTKQ